MWRWAANLSKARRARMAAVGTILPLVERSQRRLGSIPDAGWSDPYIVGFMMMLITIIARMEVGRIDSETICHVQTKAWEGITGQTNVIGEEVLLLSAANNRNFQIGCRNAVDFSSFLVSRSVLFRGDDDVEANSAFDFREGSTDGELLNRPDVLAAWEDCFDMRLSLDHSSNMSAAL